MGGDPMRSTTPLGILAAAAWLTLFHVGPAPADVAPGDVIDATNWQKAEGLLPEPVLNWVKKGEVLLIGELTYHPSKFLPPAGLRSLEANKGRFDLDGDGVVVDSKTGKAPDFIDGFPFPEIDPKDPRAGEKIMYNKFYYQYTCGNMKVGAQMAKWIGRNTGYEREISFESLSYPKDGYEGAQNRKNPDNLETYIIFRMLAPVDVRGTNVLTWRFRDARQDHTFTFVPAIRRVRRMSPANRSDAFLGSDFCVDDAWGYGGKVNAFEWKVLGIQEQLVPFRAPTPLRIAQNPKGEWVSEKVQPGEENVYGWQKEGYGGAPWFPTNIIWVKRPVYALEIKAKDPYYNYGLQYLWIDAEFFQPTFKEIHNRAGEYWKVEWQIQTGNENADGSIRILGLADMIAVDDRSDHATVIVSHDPKCLVRFFAVLDENDFSLAGFQKLCR
jgi:hypothetical protein